MKSIILGLTLVLVLLAHAAQAKDEVLFKELMKRMTMQLNLTEDQVEVITPIMQEDFNKRQAYIHGLQGEGVVNQKELKNQLRKFKEETNERLKNILSEEQMKVLVQKQRLRESLNKDKVDFSDIGGSSSLNPQGASLQF